MLDMHARFDLKNVPANMGWCVYEEERKAGSVQCDPTVYRVVLALRWLLTYTCRGAEVDFDTYKVHWRAEDKYGSRTSIFLYREKVEELALHSDNFDVVQEPLWFKLATLTCGNFEGIISSVTMPNTPPYDGYVELDGETGVLRLLMDAAYASQATSIMRPIESDGDAHWVYRILDRQYLGFTLECVSQRNRSVKGITFTVSTDPA
jgi:hypothetical protein